MKISTLGIPFKEVGKRLDILNRELNKHGMAILADSEATIEFGDATREVATELTVKVALFDKPITSKNANETISELIHKKIYKIKDKMFDKLSFATNMKEQSDIIKSAVDEIEQIKKTHGYEPFPEGTGHPAYGGTKLL